MGMFVNAGMSDTAGVAAVFALMRL
jgi:hypothetical protein